MSIVQRWFASTKFRVATDAANAELSETLGVGCLVTVQHEPDPSGHPGEDYLTIELSSPVADATLDAALAAYPTIAAGVTGTFAVSAGTDYKLYERTVAVGEHVVADIHLHAVLGDVDDADPAYMDVYTCIWRNTTGDVKFTRPRVNATGDINGMLISIAVTASTVSVHFSVRKAGILTIFTNDVEMISRGQLT